MPRKKKLSHGQENNKNRTKRLVQISMRAEEFTYHNKKIPTAEAQAYLAELRLYNENCVLDVRSRQVVEKLTRMMTEIIQDEQENSGPDIEQVSFTQMTNVFIPSFKIPSSDPKAVLFEPEKTQIRNQKSPKQGVLVETVFENIMDTIDLCGDADEPAIDNFHPDASVETAIGKLSIQELDNPLPMLTQLNELEKCSQSILTTFDDITCAQVVEAHQLKNNNESSSESSNRPMIILKRKSLTPVKVRLMNSLAPLLSFTSQVVGNSSNNGVKSLNFDSPKQVNSGKANVMEITSVTSEAPRVYAGFRKIQKASPKEKKTGDKKSDKIRVKKSPRKKASAKCKNIECLNDHDYNKPIIKRRKTSKAAKTAQPVPIKIKKGKMQKNVDRSSSKESKKHIVEDLSWVENLKYVRITETDEYCTCDGYEEIFWRNLDYPPDWDDMFNCF